MPTQSRLMSDDGSDEVTILKHDDSLAFCSKAHECPGRVRSTDSKFSFQAQNRCASGARRFVREPSLTGSQVKILSPAREGIPGRGCE